MRKILNLTKKTLLAVGIIWWSVACTRSPYRTPHEEKITPEKDPQSISDITKLNQEQKEDLKKSVKSFEDWTKEKIDQNTDLENLVSVIEQIQSTWFKDVPLGNPDIRSSEDFHKILRTHNFLLLRVRALDKERLTYKRLYKVFEGTALAGCDINFSSCKNLSLLGREPSSFNLFLTEIEDLKSLIFAHKGKDARSPEVQRDVRWLYTLLNLASEIKNNVRDNQLDYTYVLFGDLYANVLSAGINPQDQAKLKTHRRVYQVKFQELPRDKVGTELVEWADGQRIWTYSRSRTSNSSVASSEILALAARTILYKDAKKNLTEGFKEALENLQKEDDSYAWSSSFRNSFQQIFNKKTIAFVPLKMDEKEILKTEFYDEYFYIIDRFFRRHIDSSDAQTIWNETSMDAQALISKFEAYSKVMILVLNAYTIDYHKQIYLNPTLDSDQMVKLVLADGKNLSNLWAEVVFSVSRTSDLVEKILSRMPQFDTQRRRLKDTKDSLDRNLKLMVVFTQQYLLNHFMSLRQAAIKTTTWWGASVDVTAEKIIEDMMNGKFKNWFQFGTSSEELLGKADLNLVFYFGLTMGLFESFKGQKTQDGEAVLDPSLYFKILFEKYLAAPHKSLVQDLSKMLSYKAEMQSKNMKVICQGVDNKHYPKTSLSLVEISSSLYTGVKGPSTLTGSLAELIEPINLAHSIKSLRTDLLPRLIQVESMVEIYERLSEHLPGEVEEKKQTIAKSKAVIEEAKENALQFVRESDLLAKEYGSCILKLADLEMEARTRFLEAEVKRLGLVYDAFGEKFKKEGKSANFKDLEKDPNLKIYATDGIESIDGKFYTLSKYGAKLRAKDFMLSDSHFSITFSDSQTEPRNHPDYQVRTTGISPFILDSDLKDYKLIDRASFISTALKAQFDGLEKDLRFFHWIVERDQFFKLARGLQEGSLETLRFKYTWNGINRASKTKEFFPLNEGLSVHDLVEFQAHQFKFLHLNPRLKAVLARLREPRMIDSVVSDGLFDFETNSVRLPFDIALTNAANSKGDNATEDFMKILARDFINYKRKNLILMFPPQVPVDDIPKRHIEGDLQGLMKFLSDYSEALLNLQKKDLPPWGEDGPLVVGIIDPNRNTLISWQPQKSGGEWQLFSKTVLDNELNALRRVFHEGGGILDASSQK